MASRKARVNEVNLLYLALPNDPSSGAAGDLPKTLDKPKPAVLVRESDNPQNIHKTTAPRARPIYRTVNCNGWLGSVA